MYKNEYVFFEAACNDSGAYELYRDWIREIARDEVERMVAAGDAEHTQRDALISAAMIPFDRAFRAYRRRNDILPYDFPFSRYYRWWARQYASLHTKD